MKNKHLFSIQTKNNFSSIDVLHTNIMIPYFIIMTCKSYLRKTAFLLMRSPINHYLYNMENSYFSASVCKIYLYTHITYMSTYLFIHVKEGKIQYFPALHFLFQHSQIIQHIIYLQNKGIQPPLSIYIINIDILRIHTYYKGVFPSPKKIYFWDFNLPSKLSYFRIKFETA